jgi:hypothetical protein
MSADREAELRASIERGLAQSAAGDTHDLGDFGGPVHFLPYGSYVASCGRIEDRRYPERWTDLRRETTCGECQCQMTDHGDLPPAAP